MTDPERRCKACGKPIVFRKTEAGRWMPHDEDGTPHWRTCSDPGQFRKSDKEAQARDDGQQNLFEGGAST